MHARITPEIRSKLDAFLATGNYQTEEEVLATALDSLTHSRSFERAIQQGLEDEAAGNTISAREMLAQARTRFNLAS